MERQEMAGMEEEAECSVFGIIVGLLALIIVGAIKLLS